MLLQSLTIKNFKSLEDVTLDKLDQFNVLIGRNNSGKSAVFDAVSFLNQATQGVGRPEQERVLSFLDPSRRLELSLVFRLRGIDRRKYAWHFIEPKGHERLNAVFNSPFARQIRYLFRSAPGNPFLLHLRETTIRTEDNKWAVIQKMEDEHEQRQDPASRLLDPDLVSKISPTVPLDQGSLDLGLSPSAFVEYRMERTHLGSPFHRNGLQVSWPQNQLADYLKRAFFFNPFRHNSEPRQRVTEVNLLSQDGQNLPQVLHTIQSNKPDIFRRIVRFLESAVPNLGKLRTPIKGADTEAHFQFPKNLYEIRLHEMGAGIEQLLMIAIVLHTTDARRSLFVEEPENHLHAGAQRLLIEKLHGTNRQVFLTTHSPTFVNVHQRKSIYQLTYHHGRTKVDRVKDAPALGRMLEDIGARNSDVLLADAVLFVEGPSDGAALDAWSETLKMSFTDHNVTVLSMDGGEYAGRGAPIRTQVLVGISLRAPVPHLFVLDPDERGADEIEELRTKLGKHLHLLERRELENYLLIPRAVLTALRSKHRDNASILENVEGLSDEQAAQLIQAEADKLYPSVLLKRIRGQVKGLTGGIFTREMVAELIPNVGCPDLATLLAEKIEQRLQKLLKDLDIAEIVKTQKEKLDEEWQDRSKHLLIAPGEEILDAVFEQVGGSYCKTTDARRIAAEMTAEEIAPEIRDLIKKVVSLTQQQAS